MSAENLLEACDVIVPPKSKAKAHTFRFPPTLLSDIHAIADRQGRTVNETAVMLMTWAVTVSKAELEAAAPPIRKSGKS